MENQYVELTETEQDEVMLNLEMSHEGTVYNPATGADSFLYTLQSGRTVMGLYQWVSGTRSGYFVRLSIVT